MSEMHGMVFKIQRFSISDGPGIRTTVFFKGCQLKCIWCHNPESWSLYREVGYTHNKCILCGCCVKVCEQHCHRIENGQHIFDRKNCINCGKCINICTGALEWIGTDMTCNEVMEEVMKDWLFYVNSGGGMTLSGGEPLYQPEFCKDLLIHAKEKNINTCVETSGYTSLGNLKTIIPYTDLFLYDYKATSEKHKELTGMDNAIIHKNLAIIDKMGARTILRCPVIPGYNLTGEYTEGITLLANSLNNVIEINILPYHPLGKSKYETIGEPYLATEAYMLETSELESFIGKIREKTDVIVRVV